MKSRLAFGLIILSILAAPIGVHAQLRGLLKKKADEVQKMTDETIKEVDAALKSKEAEIMQV